LGRVVPDHKTIADFSQGQRPCDPQGVHAPHRALSHEIVAHLDLLPKLLAVAGDTEVKDKLLKDYKIGDMTYKVHIDGDNLVFYLTGQAAKIPRESFFYVKGDQQFPWRMIASTARHPLIGL
jgi:arylsulfatase A-like enzyme